MCERKNYQGHRAQDKRSLTDKREYAEALQFTQRSRTGIAVNNTKPSGENNGPVTKTYND